MNGILTDRSTKVTILLMGFVQRTLLRDELKYIRARGEQRSAIMLASLSAFWVEGFKVAKWDVSIYLAWWVLSLITHEL